MGDTRDERQNNRRDERYERGYVIEGEKREDITYNRRGERYEGGYIIEGRENREEKGDGIQDRRERRDNIEMIQTSGRIFERYEET